MTNTREASIQAQIKAALACPGAPIRLFRNTVGHGWVGPRRQTPIVFGLTEGSGDLIGWRTIIVTQEMVGTSLAQFLSVECKRERGGRVSPAQVNWARVVNESGGLAVVVKSVEAALAAVR